MTKDSGAARAPWELFVRRGFRWQLIHDPKFESSRNLAKRGIVTLDESDDNQFADDVPRDVKSIPPNTENWLRKFYDQNYNNDTSTEDKHETNYSMNNDTRNMHIT